MTQTIDMPRRTRPSSAAQIAAATPAVDHSETLRTSTAATRVSFTWFGARKAVTDEQRDRMAEPFDAEASSLSARKVIINRKHPKVLALQRLKTRIEDYWTDHTLPFPEPSVRLIRRDFLANFDAQLDAFAGDLAAAVEDLEHDLPQLQEEARQRLQGLYNPTDIPSSLTGLFAVTWDYPSVEPPSYLMQLHPDIFEQERQRVAARFDEAVQLAESTFLEQFEKVISHLCERLGRGEDGEPRVFRDSAVNNVADFFDRFRQLNIGSNAQLDALVAQAQAAIRGATPNKFRTDSTFRDQVAEQLAQVEAELSGLMVARPRRRIIRPTTTEAES